MKFKWLLFLFGTLLAGAAFADEGMWTLDNLPLKQLKQTYDFTPTAGWQNLAMHASLRMAQGCSGAFVSANGLVMTNHHCGETCLSQLSTPEKDYSANGFSANKESDELKCPDVEFNQLQTITDVTARVDAATAGKSGAEFIKAQREISSTLEKECVGNDAANLRCDVVGLYGGGRHALYQYRRYQDVRLVFAPESAIADFGGDPDNFNFPRYDLDVTFMRVYVGGKPASSEYFKFDKSGPKAGDLVFVIGNPGGTSRGNTLDQWADQRANFLTPYLAYATELRGVLWQYGNESAEHARQSHDERFFVENDIKVVNGRLQALNDPVMLRTKEQADDSLRAWVKADPQRVAKYGDPWSALAAVGPINAELFERLGILEFGAGFHCELFPIARALVRASAERGKADGERLPRYRDANLPAIEQETLAERPIYPEYEITTLAWSLEKLRQVLGADDPLVHQIFGTDTAMVVATRLVKGSKLADVAVRKQLWDGGAAAIAASSDPMVKLAILVDPESRRLRKEHEDKVEAVVDANAELLAHARFERDGTSDYPDATFTLRVSYGVVKGWEEQGAQVPPFTDFAGLYARATGSDPFNLPPSWVAGKAKLNPATHYNLVASNDIIGGNSGSPMINRDGHVVGLVFDGNIHAFGGDYYYDGRLNRSVAVDTAAIEESVRRLYENVALADELVKGHR